MARKSKKPPHVYLISAARKVWYWSDQRKEAIARASVGPDLVRCTYCRKLLPKASQSVPGKKKKKCLYAVDHIDPIVRPGERSPQLPISTDCLSWDVWLARLMFGALQVLCLPCHQTKSNGENNERRKKRLPLRLVRPKNRAK